MLTSDQGSVKLGAKVHIGYYDQEHHVLHMEKTIFEEISDDYPKLTNTEIRNLLAAFLFTGDDVFKQISSLSGGERGRAPWRAGRRVSGRVQQAQSRAGFPEQVLRRGLADR